MVLASVPGRRRLTRTDAGRLAPPAAIQRQLGHLNLATTDEYLRGLGAGEHVEKVRDLEW